MREHRDPTRAERSTAESGVTVDTTPATPPGTRAGRRHFSAEVGNLPGLIKRHWALLAAALIYTGYALFLTWPVVTDPGGLLSGTSVGGDLGGSVSQVAYVVQHHIFPFAPARFHGLNAPEGTDQAWVQNIASLPSNAVLFGFGYVFGAVAGSNVFLWLSFVLSGLSMFLLTRRLFGSSGAALLAGFAFAFYPFAVDKINGHYQYMDGFVLVLAVWRLLGFVDRPSVRNALWAGVAAAFAMWWTPYFILIAGVAFVVLEVVALLVGAIRRQFPRVLGLAILAGLPIIGLFGAMGLLTAVAGGTETGALRTQSLQELYTYSARWAEWLLPDHNNLVLGPLTRGYLTSHLHGSNFSEASLYVGISILLLAGTGVLAASFRARRQGRCALRAPWFVAVVSGTLLALVAAWFSSPPTVTVLGVSVEMPSMLIYHFTSTWRVYSRFVELLELGLCIAAAYGVAHLIRGRRAPVAITVLGAIAAIVVLDLWARPSVRAVSTTPPPEYAWLRDHPGGIVADYPLEPAVFPDYSSLFWQMQDGHPLFQGYAAGTEDESMKLDFGDLAEPGTAADLAGLGVRYVVVHPGDLGADAQTLRTQHYIVRFHSPQGSVWEVGAAPAQTRVDYLDNFSSLEGGPSAQYRWMVGQGVLRVDVRGCASCRGEVTFGSDSNQFPRLLTVRQQGNPRPLVRTWIPPKSPVTVRVPGVRLAHGDARLVLSTNVGPTLPPDGDPRHLSIVVEEPHFRVAP